MSPDRVDADLAAGALEAARDAIVAATDLLNDRDASAALAAARAAVRSVLVAHAAAGSRCLPQLPAGASPADLDQALRDRVREESLATAVAAFDRAAANAEAGDDVGAAWALDVAENLFSHPLE